MSEDRELWRRMRQVEADLDAHRREVARQIPVRFGAIGGPAAGESSSHGGCNCCDSLNCISDEAATVQNCEFCPNGASFRYFVDFGPWIIAVALRQAFLEYTSDCTWESEPIAYSDGVYHWERTVTASYIEVKLIHDSGDDDLDITGDHHVIYRSGENFSCRCEQRLEAYQPEKFPTPTTGLNSAVCMEPIERQCACCLSLDVCGFVGDCFLTANSNYVLNGLYNCASPTESSATVCYFNPFEADCCEDVGSGGHGCWSIVYNRDTRLIQVFHPDFRNVGGDPVYETTLPEGADPCDGETYEIPFNTDDYPDGPETFDDQCDGQLLPESVHITAVACDYGSSSCPNPCSGSCDYEAIEDVESPTGFSWGTTVSACVGGGCVCLGAEAVAEIFGYPEENETLEGVECVPS
jgi:hypothetical protein